MLTRYFDRRQFIRVPASGLVHFRCGRRRGECELIDISPGGLGLRFAGRAAPRLGERVDITIDLESGCEWRLPERARVVRRETNSDGSCAVGVEFSRGQSEPRTARRSTPTKPAVPVGLSRLTAR